MTRPGVMWATIAGYVIGYLVSLFTLVQFHDGAVTAVLCFVGGLIGASSFRRCALRSKIGARVD